MRAAGRRAWLFGLLAWLAACASPVPTPSVLAPVLPSLTPSETPVITSPPAASAAPTPTGTVSITPSPLPSPRSSATPGPAQLKIDAHCLSQDWSIKSGPSAQTDGDEIVWTSVSAYDSRHEPFLGEPAAASATPSATK